MKTKKFYIAAGILLTIILLAGIAFAITDSIAKNRYWKESYLQTRNALLDLAEYGDHIVENDTGLEKTEAVVHECNEKAVPVSYELSVFFDACNNTLIRYFQDVYGVDISEKLHALQVMESTYPEEVSQMVGGSYSSEFPNMLFMNAAVLADFMSEVKNGEIPEITSSKFSVKMLRTIYTHEVVHSLGFNSDSIFDNFTEAITEALSKNAMLHSGIKYESLTGYAAIQGFAGQIAACDPDFVREVLINGKSDMGEYFNHRIGTESGVDYAEYYDKLIGLIKNDTGRDLNRISYYTQFLTYEYCKAVHPDAREILGKTAENPVNLFEIKWLLGIY